MEEIDHKPAKEGLRGLNKDFSLPGYVTINPPVDVKIKRKMPASETVACGGFHTLVATVDGGVWSFGSASFGVLGLGDNDQPEPRAHPCENEIVFGNQKSTRGMASSAARHRQPVPMRINLEHFGGRRILRVAAGYAHSAAVSAEGFLYTWGCGDSGRLGHGDEHDVSVPSKLDGKFQGQRVEAIAAGYAHTVAATEDGVLWAWGKLGLESKTLVPTPVETAVEWIKHSKQEPTHGHIISNPELSSALESRTSFSRHDWRAFGVKNARKGDFVKSADWYFKLATLESAGRALSSYEAGSNILALQTLVHEHDMAIAQEVRDLAGKGRACVALADCYASAGQVTKAFYLYERSVSTFEEAKNAGCQDMAVYVKFSHLLASQTCVEDAGVGAAKEKEIAVKSTSGTGMGTYYQMRKAALSKRLQKDSTIVPVEDVLDRSERLRDLLTRCRARIPEIVGTIEAAQEALKGAEWLNKGLEHFLAQLAPKSCQVANGGAEMDEVLEQAMERKSVRDRMKSFMQTISSSRAKERRNEGPSSLASCLQPSDDIPHCGIRKIVSTLLLMLGDEDGWVRLASTSALRACIKSLCVPAKQVEPPTASCRETSASYTPEMGQSVESSSKACGQEDQASMAEERRVAIEALGYTAARGDQRVLDKARVWLESPCWGIRCAAAATVGRVGLGDANCAGLLVRRLLDDGDPSVRAAAAAGLLAIFEHCSSESPLFQESDQTESVIADVAHHLVHPNRQIRHAAQASLIEAGIVNDGAHACTSSSVCAQHGTQIPKHGIVVARTLAGIARDNNPGRSWSSYESRAEACQLLLKLRLWDPVILPPLELYAFSLWHADLTVRRRAADHLSQLAFRNDNEEEEEENTREVLVQMLSIGLDDTDPQVRRFALGGLERICRPHDEHATRALAEMLHKETDKGILTSGIHCLSRNNTVVAHQVLPLLTAHRDKSVSLAARDCLKQLEVDVHVVLLDIQHPEWPNRLACVSRISSIFSKRGATLVNSNFVQDCRKPGFNDGDCVLAVLDRQLHLDMSIDEMRQAAPFVHKDGVRMDDEKTWLDLEETFPCRIVLVDLYTLRTLRRAGAQDGAIIYVAILNAHAFVISAEGMTHLNMQRTQEYCGYHEIIAAITQRLEDGHEDMFIRYAAARALGDVSVDGDALALAALKSQFSVNGLEAVTMSALSKVCTAHNRDVLEFMCSKLDSSDSAIVLPTLVCFVELFALGADGCHCGKGDPACALHTSSTIAFIDTICNTCERMIVHGPDDQDVAVTNALKWVRSSLLGVSSERNLCTMTQMPASRGARLDRQRIKEKRAGEKEARFRRWRNSAIAELKSDVGVRRFDALGKLELWPGRLKYLDIEAIDALASALFDVFPRVRRRAMLLLRRCAKSTPDLLKYCVDLLLDVINKRDTANSTNAVLVLGDIVPRGHPRAGEVVTFLLKQLNIQRVNYLGHGIRRSIWDRVVGFRQATLETLFKMMPSGDSKTFVGKLAVICMCMCVCVCASMCVSARVCVCF